MAQHSFSLPQLVSFLAQRRPHRPFLIALSGFGGAGKSTAARYLAEQLQDATVIPLDDFIVGRMASEADEWKEDIGWGRLIREVLEPLRSGQRSITYGLYDWNTDTVIRKRSLRVPLYLILEGVGLFREALQPYFDLTVWLDAPLVDAMTRGKRRDKEEYGVDHDLLWDAHWSKKDEMYARLFKPREVADVLLCDAPSH